ASPGDEDRLAGVAAGSQLDELFVTRVAVLLQEVGEEATAAVLPPGVCDQIDEAVPLARAGGVDPRELDAPLRVGLPVHSLGAQIDGGAHARGSIDVTVPSLR